MQRLGETLLILAAIPMVVSCSQSDAELVKREVVEATKTFDAGIVFTDQEHRIAFPLNDPKIKQASDVERIESSCDCVSFEVVQYKNHWNEPALALIAQFHQSNDQNENATSLAIDVNLRLANDYTQRSVVKVLLVSIEEFE